MHNLPDLLLGAGLVVPFCAGGFWWGRRANEAQRDVAVAGDLPGSAAILSMTPDSGARASSGTGREDALQMRSSRDIRSAALSGTHGRSAASTSGDMSGQGAHKPRVTVLSRDAEAVLNLVSGEWLLVDSSDRVIARSEGIGMMEVVRDVDIRSRELLEVVRSARRSGSFTTVDFSLQRGHAHEGQLDVHVRLVPLADGHVVVALEDQTQARRIEATRRDFVVNVSHELKTPVGGLRLLAEAVEDAADDPETVIRFAKRMQAESVRLANLVREIVDLSRLQGADPLAEAVPVDIAECAASAVDDMRLLAENRDMTVQLVGATQDVMVMGDVNLLTTAIRNLVNNAVNYSEPGTKVIVAVLRDGDDVHVEVRDEGIGLTAIDKDRIFERFYRVDAARSRATGGSGLGLAIVKHVCAVHGGSIDVWSEPGVGSTFDIQLPALHPPSVTK